MGGVSISTIKAEAEHIVKIKEGDDEDEFILIRHEKYSPAINVLSVYGEQESRSTKDKTLDKWGKLLEVIQSVLSKGESLIIFGDLNRHIGSDNLGVYGNHDKISYGGTLVRDLIEDGDLILVNNSEKAGGPYTRFDPNDPHNDEKKSCLDLAIVSKDFFRFVENLYIDKDCKYPLGRVVLKKGAKTFVKADHYPMILKFKDIPINRCKFKQDNEVRFNLKKEGGWNIYKAMTEECDDLLAIVNDDADTVENIYKKFEKIHNKIKFKSFGKTRIRKQGFVKEDNKRVDQNVIEVITKQKSERLEKEIADLKASSSSRPTRVFKLLENIKGPKKGGLEAVAIVDPETNDLKTSKKEIMETTVKYCVNLLTNNAPDAGYEKDIAIKNKLHEVRMNQKTDNDEMFDAEDFQNAVKRFSAKNKSCYDYLTKAGNTFQDATKILMERIWKSEEIPEGWFFTMLIMLYKGRGLKEIMDNNRFIHSKQWMPRLFEDLVVSKMKHKVLNKTTKFQIGGMKGHRATEHLFSVKSVIAYYALIEMPLLIQCIDIRKYFDKENLRDAMCALYSAGVKGKIYRLWYKLNEKTQIAVKTGVGVTDVMDTGETLGQGTVGGALASALNIDEEINAHFKDSEAEISYGSTRLQPVSFQDDVLRMCTGHDDAQEGFNRFEAVFKTKLLQIHPTKSCYLLTADTAGFLLPYLN